MNKEPKAIYLKSVFKDFKSDRKVGKLIKDFIIASNGSIMKPVEKPKDKLDLAIMGREFILKHTPEFLEYAVDYSMFDKFGFLNQEKDLPKKSD